MATRIMPLLALACLTLVGCGGAPTAEVTGVVTWNGKPLSQGYVTFYPVGGTDAVQGGEIANGEYRIKNLSPGKKKALITLKPDVQVRKEGSESRLIFTTPLNRVNEKTPGNNRVVDVQRGEQKIDLTLTSRT